MAVSERWLPINNYEGYYEVSNLGNVRGLDRYVNRNGFKMKITGHTMKPAKGKFGYMSVQLRKDGRVQRKYVHRLVAESFLGVPDGLEINHIDENKQNNCLSNLEWVTRSKNLKHNNGSRRRVLHRMKPVIVFDGVSAERYESINSAARSLGASPTLVSKCCHHFKNQIHVYGKTVMFEHEWDMKPTVEGGGDA